MLNSLLCSIISIAFLTNLPVSGKVTCIWFFFYLNLSGNHPRGRRDHDRMVVGFMTTFAISVYHHNVVS